jgi:hypothetical protein
VTLTDLELLAPSVPWRSMFDAMTVECKRLQGDGAGAHLPCFPATKVLAALVQTYRY